MEEDQIIEINKEIKIIETTINKLKEELKSIKMDINTESSKLYLNLLNN